MKLQFAQVLSFPNKKKSIEFINISVNYIGFWTVFHAILFILHRVKRNLLGWSFSILAAAAEKSLVFFTDGKIHVFYFFSLTKQRQV